jgi:hypothetical protein
MTEPTRSARELVVVVLAEAVGSSITPFVPVPWVDDYIFERLLRRIARKVIERTGARADEAVTKGIVDGYVRAGAVPLGTRAFTAAARFLVRKVSVVLDVKRSHDVFGEAIAFALALDVAVELGSIGPTSSPDVGAAIYRATQSIGSAAVEMLTRAAREALKTNGGSAASPDLAVTGFARVSQAIGNEVDDARARLDHLMRYELAASRAR